MVTFAGPQEFPGGQCVGWLRYKCETASEPRPGDLVVQLPDDPTRDGESNDRETLFSYSWLGRDMPKALGKVFYASSPLYTSGDAIPQHWLTTSAALQQ